MKRVLRKAKLATDAADEPRPRVERVKRIKRSKPRVERVKRKPRLERVKRAKPSVERVERVQRTTKELAKTRAPGKVQLISRDEARAILRVSNSTLRRMNKEGKLTVVRPSGKDNGRIYYRYDDVAAIVNS